MRTFHLAAAAAAFLVSGVAFAQGQQASQLDKQTLVAKLKQGSQEEVQLAQQAEAKLTSPQLKSYAQMLVHDHSQMINQLDDLASREHLAQRLQESKLPQADQKFDQAMKSYRQALTALQGPEFDQQFLDYNLAEHDHDIAELTEAQQKFQGTPVGDVVSQALPKIREHRQRAYQLLNQLEPQRQARTPMGR